MRPYYQDRYVTLWHANADEMLPMVRGDAVITDPPYNLRGGEDIALAGRSAMKRDFGTWDEDWTPDGLLRTAWAILSKGGSVLSFTSDRLLSRFREAPGWKPRGTIVWVKSNPAPHPRPAYVSATEWIVWLHKEGAPAVWNSSGYTPNVLLYPVCSGDARLDHPTQKPLDLMIELVGRHTKPGSVVIDPYAGSGTTLVAAKQLGRKAIGIEIDEAYCEMAARRCDQQVFSLDVETQDAMVKASEHHQLAFGF